MKLTLKDIAGKRANLHTHTKRCMHATGEDREYVEKAIEAGYEVLGFSDHVPYRFENGYVSPIRMSMDEVEGYTTSIEKLREEYKDDITIYCGYESEYFPKRFRETLEELKQYPLDYLILGQHYFHDENRSLYTGRKWEDEEHLALYVDTVIEALSTDCFLYLAHPDLINFVGDVAIYEKHMLRLLNELKKHNLPIELNVNGFRDRIHYPNDRVINMGLENGNHFLVAVDAHSPNELLDFENYNTLAKKITDRGGIIINHL